MPEQVEHLVHEHKFVINDSGQVSTLLYRAHGQGVLELYHTFVPDECRGRGYAQKLAKAALDYARDHGYMVEPTCDFVARYMEKNDQYKSLLA